MNIVIAGNGAWGSALASLLSENKIDFVFWKRGEKIPGNSIIILAIPTQAIRSFYETIGTPDNVCIVNSAKGIEKDTHKTPHAITKEFFKDKPFEYLTLMGPSFADEVKAKMPALVNLGYVQKEQAKKIKMLFQTDYFRVRLTRGIEALELASAFKNIYAIATGLVEGLGYGVNTRVKLITLAIDEFYLLSKSLGFTFDKNAVPATIGDLVLTCSSTESRNFTFGKNLVSYSPEKSLARVGQTVEGYFSVASVPFFEKKANVRLPLARFVYEITHGEKNTDLRSKFNEFVKSC